MPSIQRFLVATVIFLNASRTLAVGPQGDFFVGYNQAWIAKDYGSDLTTKFDPTVFANQFEAVRANGGSIVRIFLFTARQGIQYKNGIATSLSKDFLANFEKVLQIAKEKNVKVYVTGLLGPEAAKVKDDWRQFYVNLFTNAKALEAYHKNVLTPVLKVMNKHQSSVYAFDMMNEIDAVSAEGVSREENIRWHIKANAEFVKKNSPWLKKTASVGWGGAQYRLTKGLLTGLGLDFYDLHIYSDSGKFSGATDLCQKIKKDGLPIVLGEFGQKTEKVDDQLQVKTAATFLNEAYRMCFSGALAWVLDHEHSPWWSYRRSDGSMRPAAELLKSFSEALPKKSQGNALIDETFSEDNELAPVTADPAK